jgi:hypothetical protein
VLLGGAAIVTAGEPREWSDLTGKYTRHGDFENIEDGFVLVRERDTDKLLRLPLEKLSLNDLRHLLTLKRVASGTLKACEERFAVAENGEFVTLATPAEQIYGEIIEPVGSHLYVVKSNVGRIGVETLDQGLMPGSRLKGRPGVKLTRTIPGIKADAQLPVYRILKPLKEEHLPKLLAAHRTEMVKYFSRQDKVRAKTQPEVLSRQERREFDSIESDAPFVEVASPDAPPLGAHYLDDSKDVKRYRAYRAKGWSEDRLRTLGNLHSALDHAVYLRDKTAHRLADMDKGDANYKVSAERLRREDAQVDQLHRELKKLH